MRKLFSKLLTTVIMLFWTISLYAQEFAQGEHVHVSWLAPTTFSKSEPTTFALYFEVDPGWHVYWRNPGDSGAAPRFSFTSEHTISAPRWPTPSRLPIEHLTNLGYPGNIAYLFELKPTSTDKSSLEIKLDLEWLVCKVDCIPGFATMSLSRPFHTGPSIWEEEVGSLVTHFMEQIPGRLPSNEYEHSQASYQADKHIVNVHFDVKDEAIVDAFPLQGDFISASAPQKSESATNTLFTFKTLPGFEPPSDLAFVVVNKQGRAHQLESIPLTQAVSPQQATPEQAFHIMLIFAFLGGVILNLMPCVFPVLSIKILHLCNTTESPVARLNHGLQYSLGVVLTFTLLGLLFLIARKSGVGIGWGYQLQSPTVVFVLILLFMTLGFGFLGRIELGAKLTQIAGSFKASSAFATGVLAVFVAAPCTGPFMGAALGASTALPPVQGLLVFICLGLGLAAPYFLLTAFPSATRKLPAPGQWMESLKQFFAFPMFATALWLTWVLTTLVGNSGWLAIAVLLFLYYFAQWSSCLQSKVLKRFALGFCVISSVYVVIELVNIRTDAVPDTSTDWQPFDTESIDKARSNGQAIFIDFTASWCITCQVNKQLVLDRDETLELFREHGTLLVQADWSRYNEDITKALQSFGRNSVPLYVFYPASGSAPEVLPQLLTQELIKAMLEKHAQNQ